MRALAVTRLDGPDDVELADLPEPSGRDALADPAYTMPIPDDLPFPRAAGLIVTISERAVRGGAPRQAP